MCVKIYLKKYALCQKDNERDKRMFCTECGTEIVEGAKFCHNCGAAVKAEVQELVREFEEKQPAEGPAAETAAEEAKTITETTERITEAVEAVTEEAAAVSEVIESVADAEETVTEPAEEASLKIPASGRIADMAEELAAKYAETTEAAEIEVSPAPSDAPVSPEIAPESDENAPDGKSIDEGFETAENGPKPAEAAAPVSAAAHDTAAAVGVPGLSTGQLLTMILAGASFLFITISITSANWLMRGVVLIACACLTFLTARSHELPRQSLAVPLAIFTAASLGDRIVTIIKRLLSHMTAGFSIEGICYRLVLIIALILIIAITFNGSKKKKIPAAVFAFLCMLFAVYHAYFFATGLKLGRAAVMYNLGMFTFFAAYLIVAWRYITSRAAQDEIANSQPVYNQVHVENDPNGGWTGHPEETQGPAVSQGRTDGAPMFCSRCGEPIEPDSAFCRKCGYPVK